MRAFMESIHEKTKETCFFVDALLISAREMNKEKHYV